MKLGMDQTGSMHYDFHLTTFMKQ